MRPAISQREARRLRRRVQELEAELQTQRSTWSREWPGGVHLCNLEVSLVDYARLETARKLDHAVVVTLSGREVRMYALPLPKAADG